MSQLKIVHISASVNGGAGIAAYRIHEALLGKNVNSVFLSLDTPLGSGFKSCTKVDKPQLNLFERGIRKVIRITDRYYSLGKLLPRKYYTAQLAKLLPLLNCEVASLPYSVYNILKHPLVINADIIHLHWVGGMLDYPSFFLQNKKPVAWTLHDMNPALGLFHYKNDVIRNDEISSGLDNVIKTIKTKAIKNRKSK